MKPVAPDALNERLISRFLVKAPGVWGKLPTQGDFVCLRSNLNQQKAWLKWVESVWSPLLERGEHSPKTDIRGWMNLDVPTSAHQFALPVSFVMPAHGMPVNDGWLVHGVLMPSEDKVGRPCPFVIYQYVHPRWMKSVWPTHPNQCGQTLLFWWARLARLAVNGHVSWGQWVSMFDAVWAAHRPGITQLFGWPPPTVSARAMALLTGPASPNDPAGQLRGVQHLPWTDWPERVLQKTNPVAAFWTQDLQGGYVHAGSSLDQLWGQT